MNRIGVFVQARLNSTRLPGKMLEKISGKTLLELNLEAAKKIKADEYALLTTKKDYPFFKNIANKEKFQIILGPENNVLERFILAINKLKVDVVVRVTGDKIIIADSFVENQISSIDNYDLVSYDEPPLVFVTCGVFKTTALLEAYNTRHDIQCLEHIKPCIDIEKRKILDVPDYLKKFKKDITIDTREDLFFMRKMFNDIYKGEPIYFVRAYEWIDEKTKSK